MKELCEELKRHIPSILRDWDQRVRDEPWRSLPSRHRIDHLPELVIGMVEASLCSPVDRDAHRDKLEAAVTHGITRREHGFPAHLLFVEYHILRSAIWEYLVEEHGPSNRSTDAILRIDAAITTATNASLWGYHRAEIEKQGRWEEGMKRMVEASSLLQATVAP